MSNTDNITSITFPAFSGTADPLSTIRIYDTDGTTVLGTGFTGAAGQYSIGMSSALSEGVHTLTATAIDAAGNESAHSAGLTVTIDTTPPDLSNIVVAGDDILTSAEIQAGFTVTGTAPGIPDQTISVGLADFTTLQLLDTATATVTGGVWSVSVPAAAVARLRAEATILCGDPDHCEVLGGDAEKGAFMAPVLLRCPAPLSAHAPHSVEAFGPVATVIGYRDTAHAVELIARHGLEAAQNQVHQR